jgi:hypothetical protein
MTWPDPVARELLIEGIALAEGKAPSGDQPEPD